MDKRNPISEITDSLYKAFSILNERLFDGVLANPVITIQKEKKNTLGTFATKPTWFKKDDESICYHEININPLYLNEDYIDILSVLVHEMCHMYNSQNNIKDTSGKKHNKKFKAIAEQVGLKDADDNDNWGYTTASGALKECFKDIGEDIIEVLNTCVYLNDDVYNNPPKKRKKTIFKYICPSCGMVVKAKAEKNIVCGACEMQLEMEEVEDEEEEQG